MLFVENCRLIEPSEVAWDLKVTFYYVEARMLVPANKYSDDVFAAVVGIEVTGKFRLVQLDHGIISALSGTLLHVEAGAHEVRLSWPGKCPFHVGQPLSAIEVSPYRSANRSHRHYQI